jgi:nitroreductase
MESSLRPSLFQDAGITRKEEDFTMVMEKIAETQVPIHDLISRRWSPRAFSDRPVETEKLLSLFEAARWSASASNEQPWSFLMATREDAKNHEAMLGVLVDSNRSWANKAPVLILALAHTRYEKDGKLNRYGFYDLGQAAANMALQATALGLATHQMAGFNIEGARERFAVPEGWEPVSVIALGYSGDPDSLSEKLREREIGQRKRKALKTFVFSGAWGNPAPIASSI